MKFRDKIDETFNFDIREEVAKYDEVVNEGITDSPLVKKIITWLQKKGKALEDKGAAEKVSELSDEVKSKVLELADKFVKTVESLMQEAKGTTEVNGGADDTADITGGFDASFVAPLLTIFGSIAALGVVAAYYGINVICDKLLGAGSSAPRVQKTPQKSQAPNIAKMKQDQQERLKAERERRAKIEQARAANPAKPGMPKRPGWGN